MTHRKRAYAPHPNRKKSVRRYEQAPGGFGAGRAERCAPTAVDETVRGYMRDDAQQPRTVVTLPLGYTYVCGSRGAVPKAGTLYRDGEELV